MTQKSLLTLATAAAVMVSTLVIAAEAQAADYVCQVAYNPVDGANGDWGFLFLKTSQEPQCEGTLRSTYFCTTGSSSATFCSGANYNYLAILHLLSNLHDAQIAEQPIEIVGSGLKGSHVYFKK